VPRVRTIGPAPTCPLTLQAGRSRDLDPLLSALRLPPFIEAFWPAVCPHKMGGPPGKLFTPAGQLPPVSFSEASEMAEPLRNRPGSARGNAGYSPGNKIVIPLRIRNLCD